MLNSKPYYTVLMGQMRCHTLGVNNVCQHRMLKCNNTRVNTKLLQPMQYTATNAIQKITPPNGVR